MQKTEQKDSHFVWLKTKGSDPFSFFVFPSVAVIPLFRFSVAPLFFPYLPGEPRQCLFYRVPALGANKDATLQPYLL